MGVDRFRKWRTGRYKTGTGREVAEVLKAFRSQVDMMDMLRHADAAEAWRIGSIYSSIRIDGTVYRRMFEPIERIAELADDLVRVGKKPDVSSWGGVWRQYGVFPSKLPARVATLLAGVPARTAHPWIEQRAPEGTHPGRWVEWDISSAYAWATSLGLPDPRTVHRSDKNTISDTGLYLVRGELDMVTSAQRLPTWLRTREWRVPAEGFEAPKRRSWADRWIPGETLNRLGLTPRKVLHALEWSREVDLRGPLEAVREELPRHWKPVYRAHWGEWGSSSPVIRERWAGGAVQAHTELPTAFRAPVWAWSVQSRVADRMSEAATFAARIFVDAAVTDSTWRPSNVGTDPGCWRAKERFNAITIRHLPWRPVQLRVRGGWDDYAKTPHAGREASLVPRSHLGFGP